MYLNRDSDFIEATNLYNKVDFSNCGEVIKNNYQDDMADQEYQFKTDTRGAYDYINEQIYHANQKSENGSFIHNKIIKTLPSNGNENWPASLSQAREALPVLKADDTTVFCGNSQVFSKDKFIIKKDGCNRVTLMIPAYDLIDSEYSSELLNSLGMTLSNSQQVYKDSFVELKCSIDKINFVSAN